MYQAYLLAHPSMLCVVQQQDVFLKNVEKPLKASQGAPRFTCSLDVHTAKQCDKVYVPSMCECAPWKCFCFMPEQPAIKRRGMTCEADPIQMHPDVLSLHCAR